MEEKVEQGQKRELRGGVLVGCGLAIVLTSEEIADPAAQEELWRMAHELGLVEWAPALLAHDQVFRITSEKLREWHGEVGKSKTAI